mmetsp:Transcript_272/g.772  ORF Transcript_272/g.772 Transcript_272/m.772 type:complete len:294 (+) Transcript_272:114-995(+)
MSRNNSGQTHEGCHLKFSTSLSLGTFLEDSLLDTASLRKGDLGMIPSTNHEDVGEAGRENVPLGILDGDNVEGSLVLLNVLKLPNTTRVASLGDHDHGPDLEGKNVRHFSRSDVDLDRVVHLHIRIRIAEGASIVGDGHGNLLGTHVHLLNTAQLVLGLLTAEALEGETSLGVEQEAEAVTSLLELHNIHESCGVVLVCADLTVYLDATLHANLLALLPGESILETIAEDEADGEALALLVGAGAGLGSPDSRHLPQVPVAGRIEALEVLLGSANHLGGFSFLLLGDNPGCER